jgi:redox-sensitive bicupin YhaK (pirin superfamily)
MQHSARNPSLEEPVHFLQIWNMPEREGLEPGYQEAWVQVIRGDVTVNGEMLRAGDGATLSDESAVELASKTEAELLVCDLA